MVQTVGVSPVLVNPMPMPNLGRLTLLGVDLALVVLLWVNPVLVNPMAMPNLGRLTLFGVDLALVVLLWVNPVLVNPMPMPNLSLRRLNLWSWCVNWNLFWQ